MTAAAIVSSTEAGVQVANHLATATPPERDIRRRKTEPACSKRLPARRRCLGNAASPGTFSGARTDDSRQEQDRDYRRDGQTPSREPLWQLCAQRSMKASVVVEKTSSS
ncbi:hypothetical protein AVEN_73631-1 [Araneus ventricosus]|uniref:Uncharacterized protein n=1 Tax=Araneus ventricosus TaxID=182803 RepID=A0A4Y2A7H3_ARAVE|nr:hypothetical protein AVEN_73631-1 [Araneus ventricosus]